MTTPSSAGPLAGRRIVLTRPDGGGALADGLRAEGAIVLDLPATRIEPLDPFAVSARFADLERYDWVVLTSRIALAIFLVRVSEAGSEAALAARRFAVVGSSTADALRNAGLEPTVIPTRFDAEGVSEALLARPDVAGTQVLYATAEGARDVIPMALRGVGATVDIVAMYRSVPNTGLATAMQAAATDGVDLVVCSAPSTVDAWATAVGDDFTRIPVASIGPVTSAAVRARGGQIAVEAESATAEGLGSAIRRYFTGL